MSCNKVESILLENYLEGTIDPLEKIILEAHINTCSDCRKELSELKLLYWELDNKANYEVEYPEELDSIGNELIDSLLAVEEKNNVKAYLDIQANTIKLSGKFIEYIPGAKKTPKMIKKASKGIAKGVQKLLDAR